MIGPSPLILCNAQKRFFNAYFPYVNDFFLLINFVYLPVDIFYHFVSYMVFYIHILDMLLTLNVVININRLTDIQ